MQIHLTFDYELFFGADSGTVENCLLKPTGYLADIACKHNIKLVFYVDAGFLYRLKQYASLAACKKDFDLVSSQIKGLSQSGHEIGLHVHPHWEDCIFENNKWKLNTTRYKLSDFSKQEIDSVISKYHQVLIEITGKKCQSYRAGGWCVQPFDLLHDSLIRNGINKDASVYPNGKHVSPAHSYDFSKAPDKDIWKFDLDPCEENNTGRFTEIPTTADVISPFFYWNLYLKMRQNPSYYRPVGDGIWLVDKKRVYRHFFSSTRHFACADGFFASRLESVLKRSEGLNHNHLSVLSHPKSMAPYSFKALEKFIITAKSRGHRFTTVESI